MPTDLLSPVAWKILDYCAQEVLRQRATPMHVTCMMEAWDFAIKKSELVPYPGYEDVMVIG